jgi:hypothetical protein
VHLPGQVFADLAVVIADGADAVTGIEVLRGREVLFGSGASAIQRHWRTGAAQTVGGLAG